MIPEQDYTRKIPLDHRKKFAQFFTPEQISDFMASWVLGGQSSKLEILEPAFGLGMFSRSMLKKNPKIRIVGYDVDKTIYTYAKELFQDSGYDLSIYNDDYLTSSWSDKFDGIICNPPYLKFHDYDNSTLVPVVNNNLNTHLNGFTNIYSLFLLKSVSQMKHGGRMAYITPSEFLNSDYGVEVKRILLQSGVLRHVIIVDYTQCAFDDALTTACILLCEKNDDSDIVRFTNVTDISKLNSSVKEYKTFSTLKLSPDVKWKQYYEGTMSSKYESLVPFSTFAKVSRGIATGDNTYFTFKKSQIDAYNLPYSSFRRCICHATDVQNLVFTEADFDIISNCNKTVYLFDGYTAENDSHVQKYIGLGEERGVNKRYLTSSRSPWYAIEDRKPSPIWVSVFNRNGLRFVRNKAGIYNLTTFHCVYNKEVIDTDILFAFLVTDVAKEILLDNSRQYGNGLVKFEPNDINNGNIVDLRTLTTDEKEFVLNASVKLQYHGHACKQTVAILDDFFRTKYTGEDIDLQSYCSKIEQLGNGTEVVKASKARAERIKQLSMIDYFAQYANNSVTNTV